MVWDVIKDETAKREIINVVRRILEGDKYKQVILVADIGAELAQQFGQEDISQIDGSLTLQDLSSDSQERLLKTENVLFQGHRINLDELLYTQVAEDYKSLVDSAIMERVVRGKEIKVGVRLLDLDADTARYYVSRRFEAKIDETGDTRNILSEENLYDLKEKMIVISDSAGMGKSTIIAKLAMIIKETNPTLWVIKINLNDYTRVLKDFVKINKTEINAVELLNSQEATKMTNTFEELVFSMNEKVVLMLDGADEISPDYTDLVLSLLNHCQEAPNFAKIFVTTRPHMDLTQTEVGLFQMLPFSELEQIDFLTDYWTYNLSLSHDNKGKCKQYADILIHKVTSWTKANEHQQHSFADIPLQARMLAEIFQENIKGKESADWEGCKEYLRRDGAEVKLPEKFNMAKLYDTFIEKKRDIFIEKGSPDGSVTATQALLKQFESCLAHHRSLAVTTILPEDKQLFKRQVPEDKNTEECILKIGILQRLGDRVHFIHRTFAEYFLADGIVQELKLNNLDADFQRLLIDRIFENDEFNIVRTFLDVLLHKVSLPTNIFKGYNPKNNEESNVDLIFKLAHDGHVAILRLILESVDFKVIEDRSVNVNDWRIKLSFWKRNKLKDLAVLVRQAGVNIEREDGETPLHLAVKGGHLDMVDFLLKHGADVNAGDEDGHTALHLAVQSDEIEIVEYVLKHGADINKKNCKHNSALHMAARQSNSDMVEYLVEHGADINMIDSKNDRVLHMATRRSNYKIVKYLVDHGVNVNVGGAEGLTALHLAATFNSVDIVEFLLEHGAYINMKGGRDHTALHMAAYRRNWGIVKFLVVHGADVNAGDDESHTALHLAAKFNNMETVTYVSNDNTPLYVTTYNENWDIAKFLIEHGADVNGGDDDYLTAFHVAVKFNEMDSIGYLLRHGVDVNIKNGKNNAALHIASYNEKWDIANYLVKHGADIKGADEDGLAALHFAARFGEMKNVKYLLEQGVDINIKNGNNNTALHIASHNENWGIADYLVIHGADVIEADQDGLAALYFDVRFNKMEDVKYLLEQGVSVNMKNAYENTVLHKAVYCNNVNVFKLLVDHDAEVNARNKSGNTALHVATRLNTVDIVDYLLDNGADINMKNGQGDTALHKAVYGNYMSVYMFLVEHGADVNARNKTGDTALHVASTLNKVDIVNYLLDNGSDINMKNDQGDTALHKAVYVKNVYIFKVLVKYGADVNARDERGRTVLDIATHLNKAHIVNYLLENGEDIKTKNG